MTERAQDELFPDLSPPAKAGVARKTSGEDGVAPAVVDPALATLAARVPRALRFGTSTWSFPGWNWFVYCAEYDEARLSRAGLEAYAAHPLLRAVGVDRSFYAPLTARTLERYAAMVPDDFRFLMKAHAALTTPKSVPRPAFLAAAPQAFLDAEYAQRVVIDPARRAWGEKLGVVLFQFSPLGERVLRHRALLIERLADFLHALPRDVHYAFEWRDPEILGADYHAMLASEGGLHGACSHPRMPRIDAQGADPEARGPLVLRWLLRHDRAYQAARAAYAPFDRLVDPDVETRARIARLLNDAVGRGREALLIVNNKAEGSAPHGIAALAAALA